MDETCVSLAKMYVLDRNVGPARETAVSGPAFLSKRNPSYRIPGSHRAPFSGERGRCQTVALQARKRLYVVRRGHFGADNRDLDCRGRATLSEHGSWMLIKIGICSAWANLSLWGKKKGRDLELGKIIITSIRAVLVRGVQAVWGSRRKFIRESWFTTSTFLPATRHVKSAVPRNYSSKLLDSVLLTFCGPSC